MNPRRAFRQIPVLLLIIAWPPRAAAGLPPVDPDGAPLPHVTVWSAPRAVDAAAFPSAGRPSTRGTPTFLSVDAAPEGDMPREIAFLPDGSAVAVANRDTDALAFLDVATRAVTHMVTVGDFPVHVAVTPDGQYAVTANVFSNDVSIVDVPSHALVSNVPITGTQPYRVAITPDSRYAVVGIINDAVSSSFSVIDLDTQSEIRTFASTPQGVIGFFLTPEIGVAGNIFTHFALSPDGTRLVLPDRAGSQVTIYDPATGGTVATLPTAASPAYVDISADNQLAVVVHDGNARTLTLVDLTTSGVSGTIATTSNLDRVGRIYPDKSHMVCGYLNDTFFVNLTSGAETARIITGTIGDIELTFDGQYAVVSNFTLRTLSLATQSVVGLASFAACAEMAVSPNAHVAVALNNRFREDAQFYNVDGASTAFLGRALSGSVPEGDSTRVAAIAQDGSIAVVGNNTSRNITVIDLCANTPRSYVDVGDRILDVAITPAGDYAVVCAADADLVGIVDLSTDTLVAALSIVSRPSRVRISPDGQWAYVLNIAGTDRVSFIQLAGAASTIVSQVSAGQTGSIGYTYTEISGIELSPDGAVLAVCDSFNDQLKLYDTATRTMFADVAIGDFPIRAAFSPDGSRVYVANSFSDNVSVVEISGGGASLLTTVATVDFPLTIDVDASYAYVSSFAAATAGIHVIDRSTHAFVHSVSTPEPRDAALSATDGTLYVATTAGTFVRIAASGPASAVIDSQPLTSTPADLAFHNGLGLALASLPVPDGVDVLPFGCGPDLDGNRIVSLADLTILLGNFGALSGAARLDGDLDCDGDVDLADLTVQLAAFGSPCP